MPVLGGDGTGALAGAGDSVGAASAVGVASAVGAGVSDGVVVGTSVATGIGVAVAVAVGDVQGEGVTWGTPCESIVTQKLRGVPLGEVVGVVAEVEDWLGVGVVTVANA